MLNKLRGIRTPAWLTALLRGLGEAVVFALIYAASDALSTGDLPDSVQAYGPLLVLALRMAEGMADHVDPLKVRRRHAADRVS